MFVNTRPSTFLALLLLMATLQLYHLLSAEQSSLVPSFRRPMQTLNIGAIHTPNHTVTGLLGDDRLPPDAQSCVNSFQYVDNAITVGNLCRAYQRPWLKFLLAIGLSETGAYSCEDNLLGIYCENLVARTYCRANLYASYHDFVKQYLVGKVQECKKWLSWQPPMDSPPPITNETIGCEDTLEGKGVNFTESGICSQQANETAAKWNIQDPTEFWCKRTYEMERCAIREACKHCGKSAQEYLNFAHSVWSPKMEECAKWTSEEPKMECSVPKGPTTPAPQAGSCLSVLDQKGIPERCDNESHVKYPDPTNLTVEMQCRVAFYSFDCGMKAACEQCSDPKDYVELARKSLDSNAVACKPWLGDEPTLKCPSNMILLIVGVVIAVVIILVVICVVVYCICFTDKSERRSSSKGGRRSKPKASTPRSRNKAGSSIEAKQTSRAAAGTKKQSSRMVSCGPAKKQSRASKGAKPRSRVKQSKRSRASALK